jgi:hypothetical protein
MHGLWKFLLRKLNQGNNYHVLKIGHNRQKRKSHISITIEMCNYPSFALCFAREFICNQLYIYNKNCQNYWLWILKEAKKEKPFHFKRKGEIMGKLKLPHMNNLNDFRFNQLNNDSHKLKQNSSFKIFEFFYTIE